MIKIECQVKPVPAGERRRQEIAHGLSIGESLGLEFGIKNSEFPHTRHRGFRNSEFGISPPTGPEN